MTTLILAASDPEDQKEAWQVKVQETFDEAIDKVFPIKQASSSLEHRQNQTFTNNEGKRICFAVAVLAILEDNDLSS